MSIRITHVRFETSAPKTHQTITHFKWINDSSGKTGSNDKPSLVAWIDGGGKASVGTGSAKVPVGVVHPDTGKSYLRTYADGKWNNNLVSLPEF